MDDIDVIENSPNVFTLIARDGSKRLATKALVPGGEGVRTIGGAQYRIWDPYHSKLAALFLKGISIPVKEDSTVLYLGAASGTTVSHVSDMVPGGTVFAVEFSPRSMKDLIDICIPRMNLIPILADARNPGSYRNKIIEVDLIYQDVAAREQALIANRNAELFLKKGGYLVLMIKTRSIDSVKKTDEVSRIEIKKMGKFFDVNKRTDLEPFHSDHVAVIAQKTA